MTRGAFVLRGALAAAAVYGAGAVTPFVTQAFAQSDASDAAILDFALRLEILEHTFYELALKQVPRMSRDVKNITTVLRDDENEHVKTISETINQLGTRASPRPKLDFGTAFQSEQSYLQVSMSLEDTGVSAYNGAGPMVFEPKLLEIAGEIVQVEARHASTIRDVQGEQITAGAFDAGASMADVTARAARFFKS